MVMGGIWSVILYKQWTPVIEPSAELSFTVM